MTREEKQKAIDVLKKSVPVMAMTQEEFNDYIQTINQIMDWLEQQPCEDCISRQAVLDICDKYNGQGYVWTVIRGEVEQLPSVIPQQKMGHWIGIDEEPHEYYKCDKCGYIISYTAKIEPHMEYKYCPNCGAKMIEPQEGGDEVNEVLAKIRAEMHATAEKHEDGDYYLRDEWIDEIIDKYKAEGGEE